MKYNLIYFVMALSLFYTNVATAINEEQFVTDITEVKSIARTEDLSKAIELWISKESLYARADGHYEYQLGLLYDLLKNYNKAEESFKKGIKVTDKYPRLYTGLVSTYIAQEKMDDARYWANKAVTDYPRWPFAHISMASVEAHLKNHKLAIKSAQKSLSISPKESAIAHYIIGVSSYYLGDYMNAGININKAIQSDNSYLANRDGMLIYAESLVILNKFEAASTALEALVHYNPDINSSDIVEMKAKIKERERIYNK